MTMSPRRALLLGATLTLAQTGAGHAQAPFTVPAGSLSVGLNTLGGQAGVSVIAPADLVGGRQTTGVANAATLGDALGQLLAGTGLIAETTASGAVVIRRPEQGAAQGTGDGAILLDPISVAGATATGPVRGYRPERSLSATRTDTPLHDVPQTVDIVGRQEIEDRQVQSLTQAVETVPNVQQNSTGGNRGDTFLLRGFKSTAYAIDGTSITPTADRPEVFLDFANVERVEVLKGPAAVLYGQGEPGGVINVVTRRAQATPGGDVSLTLGSFGQRRLEGTATGALDDAGRLRARISAALNAEDGFQSARPKSERQFVAGVLEWDATEATTLTLGIDYTRQKLPFDRGLIVGADNEVLSNSDLWLGEDWSMIDSEKTRLTFDSETRVTEGLKLRSHLAFEDSFTADQGIDLRGLEDDGRTLNRRWTDRTEAQQNLDLRLEAEARLSTGSVDHTVLAGVQYGWSEMDFWNARANIDPIDIYDPVYGAEQVAPEETRNDYLETIRRRSFYLQDQIDLSTQWKLLAGLRYDDYDITRDVTVGSAVADTADAAWTGRFGVVYQPSTALSLYGSWAQSFVPQAGVDRAGGTLPAEAGEQFEVGLKYDTGAVSTTLSAFQITKSNVATSDPDAPDADWSVVTGEQRVRGLEAEVTGAVGQGWHLHGALGLLEAEITRDEDYAVGNRLPGVPRVNASLWATYQPQAAALQDWTFGAGIVYVGARKGDLDNSFEVDGYTRLDASAEWRPRDDLRLQVMLRNITDEFYIVSPVSRTENYAGAPRTVVAKLTYRF